MTRGRKKKAMLAVEFGARGAKGEKEVRQIPIGRAPSLILCVLGSKGSEGRQRDREPGTAVTPGIPGKGPVKEKERYKVIKDPFPLLKGNSHGGKVTIQVGKGT